MLLCIAFIDLTKAFDLVSRDGLFKVLPKIDLPKEGGVVSSLFVLLHVCRAMLHLQHHAILILRD